MQQFRFQNKIILICVLFFGCSDSQKGQDFKAPISYNTPDAQTLIPSDTSSTTADAVALSGDATAIVDSDSSTTSQVDTFLSEVAQSDTSSSSSDTQSAADTTKKDTGPPKLVCIDKDKDGFGINCDKGVDCDGTNNI